MSKHLFLGDIHGRTIWKDIIAHECPDKVTFLGDYVSTHGLESEDQQINNLIDIMDYKEHHADTCDLLIGNHDNQHMGYYWAQCSGWFENVAKFFTANRNDFLRLAQWAVIHEFAGKKYIASHAGISLAWITQILKLDPSDIEGVIAKINTMEPSENFGFTSADRWDCCGESPTQSCTWIRPDYLAIQMPKGYGQIVGHTPVWAGGYPYDCNFADTHPNYDPLWRCDTLGSACYLIVEDDKFVPKKLTI